MMRASTRSVTGFTLIEMMVAIALGLIVSLLVGTVYVQGSRAHSEDDRFARMVENGRFAIDQITRDLRMIAFWGEMLDPSAIGTGLVAGEECGMDVFNGSDAIMFNNAHASPPTEQFDITANDCPDVLGSVRDGTSQLVIKHASGVGLEAGASDGIVYLRSNGTVGTFIDDAGSVAAPSGFRDWEYVPSLYYIGGNEDIPMLCRTRLSGSSLETITEDECLASGIEEIHVQFGIDSDGDGVIDQYKSNPTATEISSALTAQVYVLARGESRDPAYTNKKNYRLGDVEIPVANDHFHRRVFSSTVKLRNPANLALLR